MIQALHSFQLVVIFPQTSPGGNLHVHSWPLGRPVPGDSRGEPNEGRREGRASAGADNIQQQSRLQAEAASVDDPSIRDFQ